MFAKNNYTFKKNTYYRNVISARKISTTEKSQTYFTPKIFFASQTIMQVMCI